MRLGPCSAAFACGSLLLSAPARAEPAGREGPAAEEAPQADQRVRVGIVGGLAGGYLPATPTADALGVMGVSFALDVGAQFTRGFALFARLEGTTAVLFNQASLAAIVEWRTDPNVALGVGVGYDLLLEAYDIGACGADGPCDVSSWGGVSVPLVFGYLIPRPHADGQRSATIRVDFEWAPGVQPGDGRFGWHGGLRLGAAWM